VIVEAIGYTRTNKLNVSVQDGNESRIGDLVMPRGGSVTGMVLDGSGKGVPGAMVTLSPADAQMLPGQYSAKTALDGRYTLRSIPVGRFYIRANRSNSSEANPLEELQIARDSERQIVVAEGQETKMDLTIQQ
jgi:protocatechuate 3,4-dioxygenase beta subunit